MKKLNSLGSAVLYIAIILGVVVLIAAIGVTIFLLARANEEGTDNDTTTNETSEAGDSDDENSDSQETTDGDDEAGDSDDEDSDSQETRDTGDYTISNLADLVPVCSDNSFPSGIVSTSSGKKTAVFLQPETGDDYEYSSSTTSSSGLSPSYTSNEVDLVACLEATGTESFQIPCTINGTSFELVGYEFDVTVYDLHAQKEVGSSKVSHSERCPIFATLRDGKSDASTIDGASLGSYINSL